jgi:hypothetical protein
LTTIEHSMTSKAPMTTWKRLRGDLFLREQVQRLEQQLKALREDLIRGGAQADVGASASAAPVPSSPFEAAPPELRHRFDDPFPWMAPSAVRRAASLLRPDMTALEYGGGASTPYWCERVGVLHTVEASPGWAGILVDYMSRRLDLIDRWRLHFVPANWPTTAAAQRRTGRSLPATEIKQRLESDYADIVPGDVQAVFVDGAVREATITHLERLLPTGAVELVVVDNTDASYVSSALDSIDLSGFEREDYRDPNSDTAPTAPSYLVTTVYVRRASS